MSIESIEILKFGTQIAIFAVDPSVKEGLRNCGQTWYPQKITTLGFILILKYSGSQPKKNVHDIDKHFGIRCNF